MLDGTTCQVEIDPMSSACEVFSMVCFKIHLDDPTEFALYETYDKWNLGAPSSRLETRPCSCYHTQHTHSHSHTTRPTARRDATRPTTRHTTRF